ncbi:MAG TPA: EAL domain-containing protein, partial [Burkholderiales bacterium]|nr:EAL domain-containing protein [Burkholderiales bacterium]
DLQARRPFRDLLLIRTIGDGDRIYARISGKPIFDDQGTFKGYQGTGRDMTAQVLAEQRLARLRDFYAALSRAQSAIIHSSNQQALLQEICEVAVTHGRVLFARIGLIDPATGWLENAAVAGNHNEYPYKTRISVRPDIPEGQGTAGEVLRSGTPHIDNDIRTNPRVLLWQPHLLAAGILSIAIYPLQRGGRVVGSLHLYASERNWFDDELLALIHELASNISFALDNLDREATRQATEKALRHSEQRFRDIADAAAEFVWENDLEGRFTYLSARVVDVLGYTADELLGRKPTEFMPAEEVTRVKAWLAENMQPDRSFRSMEHIILSKNGEEIWMQVSGVPTWDENGKLTGHRGMSRDVTAIKQSEARISYLATRDPLTELPNRLLFNDRLEQGIINARRNGEKLAVLFIDLDRFKNINDSLGHHIGDQLLKEVSRQMADCIRKGDTLSRLGGDEFVVTLEGLGNADDAAQVARKILAALGKPIRIGGHLLNTTCSMGISIFPNDADDGRELMKNADTAMYHAKEIGRNNFQFFSPEMNVRAVERHQLETALRRALENDEFVLHYQPQADLITGALVGMEALIRWQHPERGLVPPASFIPVAEESGLIELIGQWALRTACEQNRRWQLEGLPPLRVAVNISARQFGDSRGFADVVASLLKSTGLDPSYLELEITESMLLKNVAENVKVLQKLGELGARIAVDDFGTGYSSLAYLKQLPIDTLKIDRTFVGDIETDADDAAIIQAIIAMAHGLDLRVTAEGVETEGQLAALRRLGCDEYQGYLLAKPLPAAEFRATFLTDPKKSSRRRQRHA